MAIFKILKNNSFVVYLFVFFFAHKIENTLTFDVAAYELINFIIIGDITTKLFSIVFKIFPNKYLTNWFLIITYLGVLIHWIYSLPIHKIYLIVYEINDFVTFKTQRIYPDNLKQYMNFLHIGLMKVIFLRLIKCIFLENLCRRNLIVNVIIKY